MQLFFSTEPPYVFSTILGSLCSSLSNSTDGPIQIDDPSTEAINWAPTMNTLIPERFECLQQSDALLSEEQEALMGHMREVIDETRLAALCCELVFL